MDTNIVDQANTSYKKSTRTTQRTKHTCNAIEMPHDELSFWFTLIDVPIGSKALGVAVTYASTFSNVLFAVCTAQSAGQLMEFSPEVHSPSLLQGLN